MSPTGRIRRAHVRIGILFSAMVILDQVTKMMIRRTMLLGQSIPVLGRLIQLTYVENPGIAFGIRVGNARIFTILSILASIGVFIYLVTHWNENMGIKTGLTLILGGACGNLIDRILYHQVVDFIDIGIRNTRWPVFNVADSAVVIGMFIFFITVFIQERQRSESPAEEIVNSQ